MIDRYEVKSDRVLVEPDSLETVTESGIVLPDTVEQDPQNRGTVVKVGPGYLDESGSLHPIQTKPGSRVVYGAFAVIEIELEGKTYVVVRERDILLEERNEPE